MLRSAYGQTSPASQDPLPGNEIWIPVAGAWESAFHPLLPLYPDTGRAQCVFAEAVNG